MGNTQPRAEMKQSSMSRIQIVAAGSILAGQLFVVLGGVAAHERSTTGDRSAPRESASLLGQSWFDPTLPGTPNHTRAWGRRNLPPMDPLEDPVVIPVSNIPLLGSLLGRWQEIDPYSPYTAHMAIDSVSSGTLECTATHGGTIVETKWRRSWITNLLPKSDVHNLLFATDEAFYVHRAKDHGPSLQLAGKRSDPASLRVSHSWEYSADGEEWSLVSSDTLKLSIWQSRSSGGGGTVLVEDHLFARVKESP